MGFARKLLGGVEARKKRYGLGHMSRKVGLSDGSVIKVTSMRGNLANIAISAPVLPGGFRCTTEEIDEFIAQGDAQRPYEFRTLVRREVVYERYHGVHWLGVWGTEFEGQNHTEIFGKYRDVEGGQILDVCEQVYFYGDDPYVDTWGPSMAWLADKIATDPVYAI